MSISWKEYAKENEKRIISVINNISTEMKNIKFLTKQIIDNKEKPNFNIDNYIKNDKD